MGMTDKLRLQVWAEPLTAASPQAQSPAQGKPWEALTRTAWDFDPLLAIELCAR